MNVIAANDLKRHGISAAEHLLANGPVISRMLWIRTILMQLVQTIKYVIVTP